MSIHDICFDGEINKILMFNSLLTYSFNSAALPENLSAGFLTRSNPNQAVQPQKMAKGLKFLI